MDKRVAPVQRLISRTGANNDEHSEGGFTLLEMVCVVAILALLALVVAPILPHGTTRVRLEAYAIATAAVLKADHAAALRRQMQVRTDVDASSRAVRSGATGQVVRVPDDVAFDAFSPLAVDITARARQFSFSPRGCPVGVITLTRSGVGGYEVRVNWFTGGVEDCPTQSHLTTAPVSR